MIIDPKTGVTLKDIYELIDDIITNNIDEIKAFGDSIHNDYEVPDEVLDALEGKESYTPDDIRTLARAVGMDHELLTSKELPEDFNDRFNKAVDGLFKARRYYRPKQEVQDASTNNPTA